MPEQVTIQDFIRRKASEHGVPEALALAVAEQESGFDPTAMGPVIAAGPAKGTRAKGTFQIVPSTAAMLGIDDPDDPVKNIDGGVRYLRQLLDQHDGDVSQVLKTYGGVVNDTQYVPAVLGRLKKYAVGPQGAIGAQATAAPVAGAPAATGESSPAALARASVLQKLSGVRPVPSHGTAPIAPPAGSQGPGAAPPVDRATWDRRADGSAKGDGFLGVLQRPDGRVSSELSIGVEFDGKEVEIPALVPTLTPQEVQQLLTQPDSAPMPRSIIDKAVTFAKQRAAQGKPYFAQAGEQHVGLFPQFQRASTASPPAQPAGDPSQPPTPSFGDTASNIGWDLASGQFVQAAKTAGQFLTTGIDPRTPTGRQNLAGMAGEAAGVALGPGGKVPGLAARAGRVLVPAAAAGLASAGEVAAENAITGGTASPAEAATEQTAYALGGQALMWPIKRVGRAVLGTRVADEASQALHQQGRAIADRAAAATAGARATIDNLSATLKTTLSQIQTAATQARRTLATEGAGKVAAAQGRTAAALADLDLAAADATVAHTRQLNDLLSAGGSTAATADAARTVLEGPAKRALNDAGSRVAASAADGPPVAVRPLQDALLEMLAPARPPSMYPTAPVRQVGLTQQPIRARSANDLVTASTGRIPKRADGGGLDYNAIVNGFSQSAGLPAEHPLPDVLKRFLAIDGNAPAALGRTSGETVPFAELHQIKRLLDDTINWDARSKKLLGQITKGFRGKVREALAVHEPYNVANAAYQQMVQLQTKGLGKRLATQLASPGGGDLAARMLKSNNPIAAQTMRDLLVGQAAEGGDRAAGQRAWDAARATWAHDNLFSAGIDGLGERLAKLETGSPEFLKVVGGDPAGQQILTNAKRLAQAVESGQQWEARTKDFVKATGKDAVAAAKGATASGDAAIVDRATADKTAAQASTATATSSVRQRAAAAVANARTAQADQRTTRQALSRARPKLTQDDALRDMFHVASYGPGSAFGVAPLWRLLRGPQRDAIMEWAAYSTPNTQRLVTALERPQNPQAMSLLLRDITGFVQAHLAEQEAATAAGKKNWDAAQATATAAQPPPPAR